MPIGARPVFIGRHDQGMTADLVKRSDKPLSHGRPHPTDNGDGANAGRSSMRPRRVPVPLRATRQGTQRSSAKLLSQPRDLTESRSKRSCRPLSLYKKSLHARGNPQNCPVIKVHLTH